MLNLYQTQRHKYDNNEVETKDYVSKSNLPFCDYVINPYVGCLHGCKYCYASFIKRFTGHKEEWGTFIDVKRCGKPIGKKKLTGKAVFLSSVTDPYNPAEKKYKITRKILKELSEIDCRLYISTKSPLVARDIDSFGSMKKIITILIITWYIIPDKILLVIIRAVVTSTFNTRYPPYFPRF